MQIQSIRSRSHAGFSLIEVMIAVLVLAVGLLALVGLQANLVRGAADAKARSRIASLVSSKMDEARAGGYFAIDAANVVTLSCAANNDVCQAQNDAAVANLVLTQGAVRTTGVNDAEYKTVTVSAAWSDAAGVARSLAMATAVSPLSLDSSNTLLNQQLSGDSSKSPVVRTDNPATAGVVPIALGNGSSSAASNPTPELVGGKNNQDIVATKFNVLTYIPAGASTVIQKRIETELVKCSCQYGAGGANLPEIYRTAQWPAIWTGERYDVFQPATAANAPGQALRSGPKAGAVQSPLCLECCRDHHDTTATGVAKFDPERSGSVSKYDLAGDDTLAAVTNTTSGTYVNACRVVRVDGFWRAASDLYSRQLGLLETETVAGVKAKTGLPTTAATSAYTSFVKTYLGQYDGTTATAPTNAQSTFDGTAGINDPVLVPIAAPSTTDYRYLHVRGLYVDYLEEAARAKLVQVLADTGTRGACPSTVVDKADCVLPYLPFTSANLTEIATWTANDRTVLGVNSGNLLALDPSQPSGGRTIGKRVGTSSNTVTARTSNSGVAVNTALTKSDGTQLGGVDLTDDSATATDVQPFEVGGTPNTGTGDEFSVRIIGGGLNPFVFYTITSTADSGECFKPATGDRSCTTNSTLPQAGSVRLEQYWSETTTNMEPPGQCDSGAGVMVNVKGREDVPTFVNYAVTAASGSGTIGTAVNNGKVTESTTISFVTIPADAIVTLTLTTEGSVQYATPTTCTVGNGGNTTVTGWAKPWELP